MVSVRARGAVEASRVTDSLESNRSLNRRKRGTASAQSLTLTLHARTLRLPALHSPARPPRPRPLPSPPLPFSGRLVLRLRLVSSAASVSVRSFVRQLSPRARPVEVATGWHRWNSVRPAPSFSPRLPPDTDCEPGRTPPTPRFLLGVPPPPPQPTMPSQERTASSGRNSADS